jgi:fucose permease
MDGKSMREEISPVLRLPIGLAFLGFVLSGMNDGTNGVLIPSLRAFYGVNDAIVGLLFLFVSFGFFLAALSTGFLMQRLGLRSILLLGAITFLIGVLPFGLKMPFIVLLVARLVVGLSVGWLETGLNIYVTTLPRSTLFLTYLHAFYGVGGLVGPVAASIILALQWGWNSVYLLLGGVNLLLLLGFSFFARYVKPVEVKSEQARGETRNVLQATLKLPVVWMVTMFLLVYVGIEVSLGNWSYSFLLDGRHEGALLAGWVVSGYWLGLTLGRFVLQNVAERLRIGVRRLIYGCMIAVGIGLVLIWLVPVEPVVIVALALVGFFLGPIYPLMVAITPKLVAEELGPSAIGVLVSISIIGIAVFPWLAGILAQLVGIWTLIPYTLLLTLIIFVLWRVLLAYTARNEVYFDEQAVEGQE